MKLSVDEFKRRFPHLAKEILEKESGNDIVLTIERGIPDPWRGYVPSVNDYIRRCNSIDEALEVIDYLEKRGEISKEEAEKLGKQLREKGLSSFGPHKSDNYYYKKALEYWRRLSRITSERLQQQS